MRRCPIPMAKPVDGQLKSLVRNGAFHTNVKNLGWLRRNWQLVEEFDCYPHPPVRGSGMPPDFYLVARLCDGRTYETGFACLSVFQDLVNRNQVFKGVKINYHPRLDPVLKSIEKRAAAPTKPRYTL